MLIEKLAEYDSVVEAACKMAGNWQGWSNFIWWGSNDIPHSDQFLLGYIVNHESGVKEETRLLILRDRLTPYWGDPTEGAHASDFGSSFCGDRDMLSGLMVRVLEGSGQITDAFRVLYNTALFLDKHDHAYYKGNDLAIYRVVNRRFFEGNVGWYFEEACKRQGVVPTEALRAAVVDYLCGEDFDEIWEEGRLEEVTFEAVKEVS